MTNKDFKQLTIMRGRYSYKNPLRKFYLKSLFLLIKAYKRYYLGIWIIKLPFYKLIINKDKTQKWKQKKKERYETLQNALKVFKAYTKLGHQMKTWLNSKEFKEKYLDINYPYPPLLNPDSIDYESISAELAWELNLPLPPKYKFRLIMASYTGHTSIVKSLQKFGITIQDHIFSIEQQYTLYYKALLENKPCVIGIYVYQLNNEKYYYKNLKFMFLSQGKPILWLLRDPLSRFKILLLKPKKDIIYHFNESSNLKLLENRFEYFNILTEMAEFIALPYGSFSYGNIYEFLCKWGLCDDLTFLDFAELAPEKIFDTCYKLSLQYDFPILPSKDSLNKRAYNTIYELFFLQPLIYEICGIEIVISIVRFYYFTEFKKDSVEISELLSLNKKGFDKEILICVEQNNLNIIADNKDYIAKKLQFFIDKLKEVIEYETKFYKTSENAIIKYLQNDTKSCKILSEIFAREVGFVKKLRPDIVASWKYYNEFEKMCAENI